jgi:hypothetical protein
MEDALGAFRPWTILRNIKILMLTGLCVLAISVVSLMSQPFSQIRCCRFGIFVSLLSGLFVPSYRPS